ncbi:thioredoxin family protein [Jeotgalibaca sp. MA1X17-3]|uniref:thioredoxin family protein n=1 Tax=Jeotgalibaca sp. MA1X17-3 TaxID=2908211 RepID=UPI001F41CE7C|nr:thioredoxin family protein [Jeotgalibaca sp. MA1X17-3]UJF15182.1 thioredoxin family protein [Jeotgalibaca sp. MA1X17-3]
MKKVTNENEIAELKTRKKLVFVFTTTWCGDCTYIKPFIPAIEQRFEDFTFVEVDRDEFLDFANELDVNGIPSFVVFHEREQVGRFVSPNRKHQEEIEDFLNQVNDNIRLENK